MYDIRFEVLLTMNNEITALRDEMWRMYYMPGDLTYELWKFRIPKTKEEIYLYINARAVQLAMQNVTE
jgi:hypothetical protein